MIATIKKFNLNNKKLILIIIGSFLLILAGLLNGYAAKLSRNNLKNVAILSQVSPKFDSQTLRKLQEETKDLKKQIINLADVIDPKERWVKKDYDLSVSFVEELNKINQFLKSRIKNKQAEGSALPPDKLRTGGSSASLDKTSVPFAQNLKQSQRINYSDLGFKEKLPGEKEAIYLLNQLYGLKEVVNLGVDYGVTFDSVNPLSMDSVEELKDKRAIKQLKTAIELTSSAEGLIEFLIGLMDITPAVFIDNISLNFLDPLSLKAELTLSHFVIEPELWGSLGALGRREDVKKFSSLFSKDAIIEQQNYERILRRKNPFLAVVAKQIDTGGRFAQVSDTPKQIKRFFYRGKATLKGKEVVVIEDALNKETVFLSIGETISNFNVKNFTDEYVVFENINDNKEMTIGREAK